MPESAKRSRRSRHVARLFRHTCGLSDVPLKTVAYKQWQRRYNVKKSVAFKQCRGRSRGTNWPIQNRQGDWQTQQVTSVGQWEGICCKQHQTPTVTNLVHPSPGSLAMLLSHLRNGDLAQRKAVEVPPVGHPRLGPWRDPTCSQSLPQCKAMRVTACIVAGGL